MALKRYLANRDTSITNAFNSQTSIRATGSNAGNSDVLPLFSVYGNYKSDSGELSQELSRLLYDFPIDDIISDRAAGIVPSLGNVKFFVRLFNTQHSSTTPKEYYVNIAGLSKDWEEGTGLDIDNFSDKTHDLKGANWEKNSETGTWTVQGGDFFTDPFSSFDHYVDKEEDNILVDITSLVEQWIDGTKDKYGVIIKLRDDFEAFFSSSSGTHEFPILHNPSGAKDTFFVKKFFTRSSEFFFKRPVLEARWDDRIEDDRSNFNLSSPLNSSLDNANSLFYYHYVKGALKAIDGYTPSSLTVDIYSGSFDATEPTGPSLATFVATEEKPGVYKADVSITGDYEKLHDVWSYNSTEFLTGSIEPNEHFYGDHNCFPDFKFSLTNLKASYKTSEKPRFRLFSKIKKKEQNLYKKFKMFIKPDIVEKISYKIVRIYDNLTIIEHDFEGDTNFTYLSYDKDGSFFDFDMALLEPGYYYGVCFALYDPFTQAWNENEKVFKFRVEPDIDEC